MNSTGFRILVVADTASNAEAAAAALRGAGEEIVCCVAAEHFVADFERERPSLAVFAFERVAGAEHCLLTLKRASEALHAFTHRRLLLCRREEAQLAYSLCVQGHYDDYVVFWPADGDPQRLAMAVQHAAREMHGLGLRSQSQLDWVREARELEHLERQLDASTAWMPERLEEAQYGIDALRAGVAGRSDAIDAQISALQNTLGWMRLWALRRTEEWHSVVATSRRLRALAAKARPLVLAIDDDEFQHLLLSRMLGDTGIELQFATTVGDAMSLLQLRRPECILMDIELPDLDGIEAVRSIRSAPGYADLRIVMLTGSRDDATLQRSLDAGASGFIAKPFNRAMLLAQMRHLLPARCDTL